MQGGGRAHGRRERPVVGCSGLEPLTQKRVLAAIEQTRGARMMDRLPDFGPGPSAGTPRDRGGPSFNPVPAMPPALNDQSTAARPNQSDEKDAGEPKGVDLIKKLSEALKTLYQVGGMPLIMVFVGALVVLYYLISPAAFAVGVFVVGIVLVFGGAVYAFCEKFQRYGPLNAFTQKLQGDWLERITPAAGAALSVVRIDPNPATGMVLLRGTVFNQAGEHVANWQSVDSCVNPLNRRLFYYWTGQARTADARMKTGYGEFALEFFPDGQALGDGRYSDTTELDDSKVVRKACELRRASRTEVRKLRGSDPKVVSGEVQRVLAQWL